MPQGYQMGMQGDKHWINSPGRYQQNTKHASSSDKGSNDSG